MWIIKCFTFTYKYLFHQKDRCTSKVVVEQPYLPNPMNFFTQTRYHPTCTSSPPVCLKKTTITTQSRKKSREPSSSRNSGTSANSFSSRKSGKGSSSRKSGNSGKSLKGSCHPNQSKQVNHTNWSSSRKNDDNNRNNNGDTIITASFDDNNPVYR